MVIRNDAHKGWHGWKDALFSFSLSLSLSLSLFVEQSPKNEMRYMLREKDLVIYDIDDRKRSESHIEIRYQWTL